MAGEPAALSAGACRCVAGFRISEDRVGRVATERGCGVELAGVVTRQGVQFRYERSSRRHREASQPGLEAASEGRWQALAGAEVDDMQGAVRRQQAQGMANAPCQSGIIDRV